MDRAGGILARYGWQRIEVVLTATEVEILRGLAGSPTIAFARLMAMVDMAVERDSPEAMAWLDLAFGRRWRDAVHLDPGFPDGVRLATTEERHESKNPGVRDSVRDSLRVRRDG